MLETLLNFALKEGGGYILAGVFAYFWYHADKKLQDEIADHKVTIKERMKETLVQQEAMFKSVSLLNDAAETFENAERRNLKAS